MIRSRFKARGNEGHATVTLNANDHRDYARDGTVLSASRTVLVPQS